MTAGQLARATQAHEPSLHRVLRLLVSLGVLAEQDDRSFDVGTPILSPVAATQSAQVTGIHWLLPS